MLAALLAGVLAVEGRSLALAEAVELARQHSPALASRRWSVAAAEHRRSQATARLLPRVSLGLRYSRLSYVAPGSITLPFSLPGQPAPDPIVLGDPIENLFGSQVLLEQPLFTGLSLLSGRDAASELETVARTQATQEEEDLLLKVEQAYFGLLRARELKVVAAQSQRALTNHLERLVRLEAEGVMTTLDVSRTRTRLAATRVQVLQAEAAEALAQLTLTTLLALEAETPLTLTEALDEPHDAPVSARPELELSRATVRAREAQARAAAGPLWPQLALRASAQLDSPNTRYFPLRNAFNPSWEVSTVLSWTAWDWGATWHGWRAAEAEARAASENARALEEGLGLDQERRQRDLVTARAREGAAREALSSAEQALQRAQRLCEAGQTGCYHVLDAEAERTRLHAEWVDARIDRRLSFAQLRRAHAPAP